MSNLIPFEFEGSDVRVIERDGEPWFVLADVCRVLEIANAGNAAARLDDDEKGVHSMDTLGGPQALTVINESGLYSLILTSRKPAAKRFKKWVTAEVLPTIRKTGSYGGAPQIDVRDPAQLSKIAIQLIEVNRELEGQIEEMRPAVQAHDRIAKSDGSLCITDAAKTLQVRPKDLFAYLRAEEWIYSRGGKTHPVAYQHRIAAGLMEHKSTTIQRSDGSEITSTQARVTPKGLTKLAREFPVEKRLL